MIHTDELREGVSEVGRALRRPEALAERWRDRHLQPEQAPRPLVFALLLLTAFFGLAGYGLTMGLHLGAAGMLLAALKAPTAAGAAWVVTTPALHVVNAWTGSRLDASTTVLAALLTCSFGALAMLAGAPLNWFFSVSLPLAAVRAAVSLLVFGGVGVAMTDVFLRVMRAIEPGSSALTRWLWLALIGAIGTQLMILLDLFQLGGAR